MPKPRPAESTAVPKRKTTSRTTGKKVTCAPPAPGPVAAFNPAAHHALIAKLAYRNWQARGNAPGSAEDDWLRAENEVRANWAG